MKKKKEKGSVYRMNLTLPRPLWDYVCQADGFNSPGDYIRFLIQREKYQSKMPPAMPGSPTSPAMPLQTR